MWYNSLKIFTKEEIVKKIFLIVFLMLTLGLLSSPVWAQQYFQEEVKVLQQVKSYADGSHKVATFVIEP